MEKNQIVFSGLNLESIQSFSKALVRPEKEQFQLSFWLKGGRKRNQMEILSCYDIKCLEV